MTQYLKLGIGAGTYLLAASQVLEVRPAAELPEAAAPSTIDCRDLFGSPAETPGCRVVLTAATLIVDRFDGLITLDDTELRPLPPVGRLGGLFDAISLPRAGEPAALRLHPNMALLAAGSDVSSR